MPGRKEGANKENKYSYFHSEGKFKSYLKAILFVENAPVSIARENAKRKVQAMQQLAKQNSPVDSPKKADLLNANSTLAPPLTTDSVSRTSSVSSSVSVANPRLTINLEIFLREMAQGRKKCELIFGHKKGSDLSLPKRLGVEAYKKMPGCYKRNLDSTETRGVGGWSEFVITYDNKFILNYSSHEIENVEEEHKHGFNHQTMGYGTFLKAAGKIKITEKGKIVISPYSEYLELGLDYIPIILFVLREKGLIIPHENIFVADEQGGVRPRVRMGQSNRPYLREEAVSFYLNKDRFPLAKAIAENKKLEAKGLLSKLLLSIDDSILNTRNKKTIITLETKRNHFKTAIVDFLLLLLKSDLCNLTDTAIEDNLSKINKSIQLIKDNHGVDLNFVKNELDNWIYYLFLLDFKIESKLKVASVEKEALKTDLKAFEKGTVMPQRFINEYDLIRSSFIRFYSGNPTKTCIALLRDYTKGGFFWRLLTGAWRRHHVKTVTKFLKEYDNQQYPDNLSIQDIYHTLFNLEGTLTTNPSKKTSLLARLSFCENLEKGNPVNSTVPAVPTVDEAPHQSKDVSSRLEMPSSLKRVTEEAIKRNGILSFAANQALFSEEKLESLSPFPTPIPAPEPVIVPGPVATSSPKPGR